MRTRDNSGAAVLAFPPPLAGEGQGGGAHQNSCSVTPSPPLPRLRGREPTAAGCSIEPIFQSEAR
jgi:hypothetical protein